MKKANYISFDGIQFDLEKNDRTIFKRGRNVQKNEDI